MSHAVSHGNLRPLVGLWFVLLLGLPRPCAAQTMTFPAGSLIIPMDVNYQNHGMLQAYGLVYRLIEHGVPVHWIVAADKALRAECDPDAGCPWDCTDPIDGGPCRFQTLSPDFWTAATVVYDDAGLRSAGELLPLHGYRGAPFVIHADDAAAAGAVIDAWNDPALWPGAPWAARSVFSVVSVHEATAPFDAPYTYSPYILEFVPRPAIVADGREAEFAAVLRAAGIPQSDGTEFTDEPCAPGACGPGTARPDLLPQGVLLPEHHRCLGTGPYLTATSLIDGDGRARYTSLALGGFTRAERETVVCQQAPCGRGTSANCFDSPLNFHGHRVLLHLRDFNAALGRIFALGEAAYALENAIRAPDWPHLDYADPGAFVIGTPLRITCPCLEPGFFCAEDACTSALNGVPYDCCLPTDPLLRGAGVVSVPAPEATCLETWNLSQRWLQFDGDLRAPLGPLGLLGLPEHNPNDEMLQNLRGYIASDGDGYLGLTWYGDRILLADLRLGVALPVTAHPETNLARLFLNSLLDANRPVGDLAPVATLTVEPVWEDCPEPLQPLRMRFHFLLESDTRTTADELRLELTLPTGVDLAACDPAAVPDGRRVIWPLTKQEGSRDLTCAFDFPAEGVYQVPYDLFSSHLGTLGTSGHQSGAFELLVHGTTDQDGDGFPACTPCEGPVDAWCGDDPYWDEDWDDHCDEGGDDDPFRPSDDSADCACTAGARPASSFPRHLRWLLLPALVLLLARRRTHHAGTMASLRLP